MTEHEAHLKEHDLKNKDNLPDGQIDAILAITKVYENYRDWRQQKNKANSKPNKANFRINAYLCEWIVTDVCTC